MEVQGDLFTCPPTDGLVHCVSRDLRMGKGIAVLFKKKFGGVEELKKQGKQYKQCNNYNILFFISLKGNMAVCLWL